MRATLVAFVLLVAACGSSSDEEGPDLAEFRRQYDVIAAGPDLTDRQFEETVDLARSTCDNDEDVFTLTYAMLKDAGSEEGFVLSVETFCPDRLGELP